MQDAFFKPSSGRATQVPRPKSELTRSGRGVGVRMSEWEYQEWVRLGATKWLRQQLMNSKRKHTTQEKKSV
jgi:hypothetical protein